MIRRPPRSTQSRSSAASDVYKRQVNDNGEFFKNLVKNLNNSVLANAMNANPLSTSDLTGALHKAGAEGVVADVVSANKGFVTDLSNRLDPRGAAIAVNQNLSLIHISEPTRLGMISYAVFCLKKK